MVDTIIGGQVFGDGTMSLKAWIRQLERLQSVYGTEAPFRFTDPDVPIAPEVTSLIPYPSVGPAITGGLGVTDVVTCDPGTWLGDPTFTYQWYNADDQYLQVNVLPIDGETAATYTVAAGDIGKFLACDVRATNINGSNSTISAAAGPATA